MNTHILGNVGENKAIEHLLNKGYIILEQNYMTLYGEIDIIAKFKETVVFIEVKSRTSDCFGAPAEAVDMKKIEKIVNSSLNYISSEELHNCQFRYDVIEVFLNNNSINHIENAFDVG